MCKIAKLFARHIKTDEQLQLLRSSEVRIAVGTPNRLLRLLEQNGLDLTDCRLIVIDSIRNVKKKTIFTERESREDLFLLLKNNIFPFLNSKRNERIKIVLF
jgi:protein CMS1